MNDHCSGIACTLTDSIGVVASASMDAIGVVAADASLVAPWLLPLAAGMTGAVLASFSGVVADRLPRIMGWNGVQKDAGLSLSHPPSHCDSCRRRLGAVDLIPVVGWIVRRGRCHNCDAPVPVIYPIVEAMAFLLSAMIVVLMGATWLAMATCLCLWVLLAVSWLDWKTHEIPDFLTVPLGALGLLASPYEIDPSTRILGAVLCGLFLWLAFLMTGKARRVDAMSYGDVALAAALGAWIGACSAMPFLLAAALAYIAYALPLRGKGIVWVPMGPALSLAFLIVAALGIRL